MASSNSSGEGRVAETCFELLVRYIYIFRKTKTVATMRETEYMYSIYSELCHMGTALTFKALECM